MWRPSGRNSIRRTPDLINHSMCSEISFKVITIRSPYWVDITKMWLKRRRIALPQSCDEQHNVCVLLHTIDQSFRLVWCEFRMTVMHTDSRPSVVTGLHEEAQGQTFVQRNFSTIEAEENGRILHRTFSNELSWLKIDNRPAIVQKIAWNRVCSKPSNKRQVIIWTYDDLNHWRIYALLGLV